MQTWHQAIIWTDVSFSWIRHIFNFKYLGSTTQCLNNISPTDIINGRKWCWQTMRFSFFCFVYSLSSEKFWKSMSDPARCYKQSWGPFHWSYTIIQIQWKCICYNSIDSLALRGSVWKFRVIFKVFFILVAGVFLWKYNCPWVIATRPHWEETTLRTPISCTSNIVLNMIICSLNMYWGQDKMATILQTTIFNAISYTEIAVFWFTFHLNSFPEIHFNNSPTLVHK